MKAELYASDELKKNYFYLNTKSYSRLDDFILQMINSILYLLNLINIYMHHICMPNG